MVECQLPKLNTGVRFPSPAPKRRTPYHMIWRPSFHIELRSLSQLGRDLVFMEDTTPIAANMVMMELPP